MYFTASVLIGVVCFCAGSPVRAETITFNTDYYGRAAPSLKGRIRAMLPEGTTATVLAWKPIENGRYAGRVQVNNGRHKGKKVWFIFNPQSKNGWVTRSGRAALGSPESTLVAASKSRAALEAQAGAPCATRNCPQAQEAEAEAAANTRAALDLIHTATARSNPNSSAIQLVSWGQSPRSEELRHLTWKAVRNRGRNMLEKAPKDIDLYCPGYADFSPEEKMGFWMQLVSAMIEPESGYKPTMTYTEKTMDIDPVTKQQVVSEGLLQLSYQDGRSYTKALPGVCDFDYRADQQYPRNDERRTIQNPEKNLNCGVAILDHHIGKDGAIGGKNDDGKWQGGAKYWSVLRSQKYREDIQAKTRKYCLHLPRIA